MKRSSKANISCSATSSPTHPAQQLHQNNSNKSINYSLKPTNNKDDLKTNNHSFNYKSAIECLTENVHLLKLSTSLSMNFFDPNNHHSNLDKKISISSEKVSHLSYDSVVSKNLNNSSQNTEGKPFKLQSPYGDWCAFSGGGGSGGCIITGPYEPMIVAKDDLSDESFESTEESDANIDLNGPVGITKINFQNMEVVWAKRPALPWFPGIIFQPESLMTLNKEIKDLMKHMNIPLPHKDELSDYALSTNTDGLFEKTYFVFLFNRKKTWLWLPENKLRPFCKENDRLFLENSPLLTSKYKKELEKGYKKAKKCSKSYEHD